VDDFPFVRTWLGGLDLKKLRVGVWVEGNGEIDGVARKG